MSTTLTLTDDVARLLKDEAERTHKPLDEVGNRILRQAFEVESDSTPNGERKPFVVKPHSFGFPPEIDLDKIQDYVDDLDIEEYRKQSSGESK